MPIPWLAILLSCGLICSGCVEPNRAKTSKKDPNGSSPDTGVAMMMPDSGNQMTPDAGPMSLCPALGDALLPGAAPFARGDMAFAHDATCQRVYMFFGDKAVPQLCSFPPSDFIDEGWYFDLSTKAWSKLSPTGPAPMKRARPSGAWDTTRNRFLVFGGRYRSGTSGPYTFLNDLWAYDPSSNTWTEISYQGDSEAPTGRMNTEMIYDADNDRVIIYGGGQLTANFTSFIPYSDIWEYRFASNTWVKVRASNAEPPARLFHGATYDTQRQRLYVFAGGGASAFQGPFYNDLWYFDYNSKLWSQIPTDGGFPNRRIKPILEYDQARDQLIMMGGHDDTSLGNTAEIWTFNLSSESWDPKLMGDQINQPIVNMCDPSAQFATYDRYSPERRASHVFTLTGDKAFMFGGRTDCGVANDSWYFDLSTYTWENLNESISGMTCYRSGRNDCDDPGAKMCG